MVVTKNEQNKEILKVNGWKDALGEVEVNTSGISKYKMLKDVAQREGTNKILVVGDNLIDDVIPAIRLKMNVLWVDQYNSRIKQVFKWILAKISKRVK